MSQVLMDDGNGGCNGRGCGKGGCGRLLGMECVEREGVRKRVG